MLKDFDLASIGDAKLEVLLGKTEDSLDLKSHPKHRKVRMGPIKFKVRNQPVDVDRAALVENFLSEFRALST